MKRHPTNSESKCRLRWLFCIFRTLSHRWQSKQQRFNDYYNYYCSLKYRDSTQYWNIENYFVTWHLIDARLFWLSLWQQLTLILIHNYLFFLHCLSLSHNALCLSLWIIVRFYWTIIVWFFFNCYSRWFYRSYKKQSSVWLHETYAHELQLSSSSSSLSSSSSSWKRFNRRRRHSSPILLLSNKFAIKWRLRRSAVEATSAAVAKNGGSDSF